MTRPFRELAVFGVAEPRVDHEAHLPIYAEYVGWPTTGRIVTGR